MGKWEEFTEIKESWQKKRFGGKFRSSDLEVQEEMPRRCLDAQVWNSRERPGPERCPGWWLDTRHSEPRGHMRPPHEGWVRTEEGRDQRTEPQTTPRLKIRERKRSLKNAWGLLQRKGQNPFWV